MKPLKITNKRIYEAAQEALDIWVEPAGQIWALLDDLTGDAERNDPELRKVVDAIFDGQEIQLSVTRWVIPLPGLRHSLGGQLYLTLNNSENELRGALGFCAMTYFSDDLDNSQVFTSEEVQHLVPSFYRSLAKEYDPKEPDGIKKED